MKIVLLSRSQKNDFARDITSFSRILMQQHTSHAVPMKQRSYFLAKSLVGHNSFHAPNVLHKHGYGISGRNSISEIKRQTDRTELNIIKALKALEAWAS